MRYLLIEADEINDLAGRKYEKYGAGFSEYSLDEKTAARLNRQSGDYLTVQTDGQSDVRKALRFALKSFSGRKRRALVAGLGNGDVVADALGKKVVEKLKDYSLAGGRLSVFAPDVGALTNLDSALLVQAVARQFSPDCVIVVDALATSVPERLGACFQFTNSGIRPGGGVGKGSRIDSSLLKTRFVAVGVPFIIGAGRLGVNSQDYFVPYDADAKAEKCAEYIAGALYDVFG